MARQLVHLVLRGLGIPPLESELVPAQPSDEILRPMRPIDRPRTPAP